MKSVVRTVCLVAFASASLAAAPAPKAVAPPNDAQTAVVKRYLDALRAQRYDDAYALLAAPWKTYFGDAANYRSVFVADAFRLVHADVDGVRGGPNGRLYTVRERIGFVDHTTDQPAEVTLTVPLGVVRDGGTPRIVDRGKPYRAYATTASHDTDGLRVSVRKVEFFPGRIGVVVRFSNLGDKAVTVLPYGKSVLRDGAGNVYRLIALKNWELTDKRLYQGVPLPPNAQVTGELSFEAARRIDGPAPTFTLSAAPMIVEGGDAPFTVEVAITPAP